MVWLLGGYMWLYIHRPFEIWEWLGALQIERAYMLALIAFWLVWPGKNWLPNGIHIALIIFTLTITVAWLASPYMNEMGCQQVVEDMFKVSVFYVLLVTSIRNERDLRLLVALFLVCVGLHLAHSLWEFRNGRIVVRMGISRMVGVGHTYSDPNAFAASLLYALPFILPFWWSQPRKIVRPLLIGFAGLIWFSILQTGSRGGFIGFVAFVAVTLLVSVRQKFRLMLVGGFGAVVALCLLSVALPEKLQNRYLTIVDSSYGPENAQESAEGRWKGFVDGIAIWQNNPFLGLGPGSFPLVSDGGMQPHNLYGQVLAEVGIMGALALVVLILCFVFNEVQASRLVRQRGMPPNTFSRLVSRAVILNVFLLLLMGCGGHNLYRYNWRWFAAFQVIALHTLQLQALTTQRAVQLQRYRKRPRLRYHPGVVT